MGAEQTHGEKVRAAIVAAGLDLWREHPAYVSARKVGKAIGLTHSAVLYHFGTSAALRDAVAAEAVRTGCRVVVPQLIALKHPAAAALSAAERRRFALDIP